MKKAWASLTTITVFLLTVPALPAGAQQILSVARAIPDQYIVVLKDQAAGARGAQSRAPQAATALAAAYGGQLRHVYRYALNGFAAHMSRAAAQALARNPGVAYVEEDGMVSADTTQLYPPWGLDRIDQRDLPLSNTYTFDATGAGVNVYVIDSGIRATHQQFGGRAIPLVDFFNGNGSDGVGHGTHVAGIIGGSTYGVAKNVRLYTLRALDDTGHGATSKIIAAVEWVTAHHVKPAVVNMSLGGNVSNAEDAAVRNSIAAGVIYVVAAGNEGQDARNVSPARVSEAITVGATDIQDRRVDIPSWWTSNYGPALDVFAPGLDIRSAWNTSDTATYYYSGTSMAAPHVTGAVALYLEKYPRASPALVSKALAASAGVDKILNPGPGSPNRLLCIARLLPPRIVFTSNRDGDNEIFVMDAGGANQRQLTFNNADDFDAVASPDGTKIAFQTNRDGNAEIYVMDPDGGNPVNITQNPTMDSAPAWSPDGKQIAFTSDRDGNWEIYTVELATRVVTRQTFDPALDHTASWSPDGTRLVFSNTAYRGYSNIMVKDLNDGGLWWLTIARNNNAFPVWSPDGQKVVFHSDRRDSGAADGPYNIWVINADGTHLTRLTNTTANSLCPSWSPDGTLITFFSDRDRNREVYVMEADGSNPVRVTTNNAADHYSRW